MQQYACLQGEQNNECFVLPSVHNDENVIHQWAGPIKVMVFIWRVLAHIKLIGFLFSLVIESGGLCRTGKSSGLQTGAGG
jgi:hypothetical protein